MRVWRFVGFLALGTLLMAFFGGAIITVGSFMELFGWMPQGGISSGVLRVALLCLVIGAYGLAWSLVYLHRASPGAPDVPSEPVYPSTPASEGEKLPGGG